jgi:hypothetical protein
MLRPVPLAVACVVVINNVPLWFVPWDARRARASFAAWGAPGWPHPGQGVLIRVGDG